MTAKSMPKTMERWRWRCVLLLLGLALLAGPVEAQVPPDFTFRGRLVDGAGTPETGPVNLELRVFDASTAGTELYAESHTGVPLDATGGFAVQLGLGGSLSGTFDAGLFSDVDRWLEVVVDGAALSPRHVFASVPWAFIAAQANQIVPDPNAPRFEDCGDGTVADHKTGLQWEKKTGTPGTLVNCDLVSCPDPHNVNNEYSWGTVGFVEPGPTRNGGAFSDFLARLNGEFDLNAGTGCLAGRCDWRLAKASELQTIAIGPGSAPGQAATCPAQPCVDPDLLALAGPTPNLQWTHTAQFSAILLPVYTFVANSGGEFTNLFGSNLPSTDVLAVRGVRSGSCP